MRLISIHGFDPRGPKVGGIETHVRHLIRRHPEDMRLLVIGIDDFGDLELGRIHRIDADGREIDFMPILHIPSGEQTLAAASVGDSVTFRFAKTLAKRLLQLRKLARAEPTVIEIERFEYGPIVAAMGAPFVLVAHNEGDPRTDKMDSILSKHWYVERIAEFLSVRFASRAYGVTPRIRDRIAGRYPREAGKLGVLTVSVDDKIFMPTPFDLGSGVLKTVYAGRLDEFKDPALMFTVAKRLHERLGGAFQFHYCGSSDPNRFPEYQAAKDFTVCHGALRPAEVAAVMREIHVGTLVSHWEGMPCFLLELLASGRPFAGLRLPQFDQVVEEGVNGRMVERAESKEESAERVADAVIAQWDEIKAGRVDPHAVYQHIVPWTVDNQMSRLFDTFRELAGA